VRAHIAVGTNLGDRWRQLASVPRLLGAGGAAVLRASRVYDAEPVGPPQPRYLNAVLEVEWKSTPEALLALLQSIERASGRRREIRWGPRTLDLDLLLFGDRVIRSPALTVPHPELTQRRFVLAPLGELCPELPVPGAGATVTELLGRAPPLDIVAVGRYPLC
jgi:2-amino-4-hydroxy-6-hydroxymethyldihydropteridine diphosphokinase